MLLGKVLHMHWNAEVTCFQWMLCIRTTNNMKILNPKHELSLNTFYYNCYTKWWIIIPVISDVLYTNWWHVNSWWGVWEVIVIVDTWRREFYAIPDQTLLVTYVMYLPSAGLFKFKARNVLLYGGHLVYFVDVTLKYIVVFVSGAAPTREIV